MSNFTTTEQVRLRNLRLLHARPGGAGGPTSDFLVQFLRDHNVSITKTELSNIYWEQKSISDDLAKSIEKAFTLPAGWLSEDSDFFFSSLPREIATFRALVELPSSLRDAIFEVINASATIQKERNNA